MKLTTEKKQRNECFFEKVSEIDKPLARLRKVKRKKIKITSIRHERRDITLNLTNIKNIM